MNLFTLIVKYQYLFSSEKLNIRFDISIHAI